MPYTYPTFLKAIEEGTHLDNYYELLLKFSNEIVDDSLKNKHQVVAKKLNLTAPKFSTIFPLLVANRANNV